MMKKTTKFWMVLPVGAVVLALGGCGGSGNSHAQGVTSTTDSSASITACFTANNTVSYAMTASNVPANSSVLNRSTVGPTTYSGQAVTGQTFYYLMANGTTDTQSMYWTVTSSGVTQIAETDYNGTVYPDGTFLPQNMSAGQTVTNSSSQVTTFVGFETLSLAGQTFSNTCHIKTVDTQGNPADAWYAPGYGSIKAVYSDGVIQQYNGD